jgi:hypothetical protein
MTYAPSQRNQAHGYLEQVDDFVGILPHQLRIRQFTGHNFHHLAAIMLYDQFSDRIISHYRLTARVRSPIPVRHLHRFLGNFKSWPSGKSTTPSEDIRSIRNRRGTEPYTLTASNVFTINKENNTSIFQRPFNGCLVALTHCAAPLESRKRHRA